MSSPFTPEELAESYHQSKQADLGDYLGEGTQTNSLVNNYRASLAKKGFRDSRTDSELTMDLFNRLRQTGESWVMEKKYPDFRDQALDIGLKVSDSDPLEQFGSGLNTATRGMGSSFAGAYAMTGAPGHEGAMETAVDWAAGSPQLSVMKYEDMFRTSGVNWEAARQYMGSTLGQAIPNMAESVITLLLGAKTGGAFAGLAVAAKHEVKSQVGKIVRSRLRKGIAKAYKTKPPRYATGVNKGKKMAVEDYAMGQFKMYGMTGATMLNSFSLNAGELYNTMRREGFDHDDSQFYAMAFGTVSALPDTIVPVWLGRQFIRASGLAKASGASQMAGMQWMGRQMKNLKLSTPGKIGVPMAFEGVTEGFQEYINIIAPVYAQRRKDGLSVGESWEELSPTGDVAWTPEHKSRIINAAIIGAVAGGLFGSAGAVFGRAPSDQPIGLDDRPPTEGPQSTDIVIFSQSDGTETMARVVSINKEEAVIRPVVSFDSEGGFVRATNFGPPVTVPASRIIQRVTAKDLEAAMPSTPPVEDEVEAEGEIDYRPRLQYADVPGRDGRADGMDLSDTSAPRQDTSETGEVNINAALNSYPKGQIDDAVKWLRKYVTEALARAGVTELSDTLKSETWALWGLGKQIYLSQNPEKSSSEYNLANPLEDEAALRQVGDIMIGYELAKDKQQPSHVLRDIAVESEASGEVVKPAVIATKATKDLAIELGVDINSVEPTGAKGNVTQKDVRNKAKAETVKPSEGELVKPAKEATTEWVTTTETRKTKESGDIEVKKSTKTLLNSDGDTVEVELTWHNGEFQTATAWVIVDGKRDFKNKYNFPMLFPGVEEGDLSAMDAQLNRDGYTEEVIVSARDAAIASAGKGKPPSKFEYDTARQHAAPKAGGTTEVYGKKGKVTVYRGIKKKKKESAAKFTARTKAGIQEGDMVTTSQSEAKRFAGKEGKILKKSVNKSELTRKKDAKKPNYKWGKPKSDGSGVKVKPVEDEDIEDDEGDEPGGAVVKPSDPKKPTPGAGRRKGKSSKKRRKRFRGETIVHGSEEQVETGEAVYTSADFDEQDAEWKREAEVKVQEINRKKDSAGRKFKREHKAVFKKFGAIVKPSKEGGVAKFLGFDGKASPTDVNFDEAQQLISILAEEQVEGYLDGIISEIAPTTNDLTASAAYTAVEEKINKLFKKRKPKHKKAFQPVRIAMIDRMLSKLAEFEEAHEIGSLLRRNIRALSLANNYMKPVISMPVPPTEQGWVFTRRIRSRGLRPESLDQGIKSTGVESAMTPQSAMMRIVPKLNKPAKDGGQTFWEKATQATSPESFGILTVGELAAVFGSAKSKTKFYNLVNLNPVIMRETEWQSKSGEQLAYIVVEKKSGGTTGKYSNLKWEVLTPTGRRISLIDDNGRTVQPEAVAPPTREHLVAFRPKKNSKDAEYVAVRELPNQATSVEVANMTEEEILAKLKEPDNGGRVQTPGLSSSMRDARTTAAIVLRKGTEVYVAAVADQTTGVQTMAVDGTKRNGLTVQFFKKYNKRSKKYSIVHKGGGTSALLQDVIDAGYIPVSVIRFARQPGWRITRSSGIDRQAPDSAMPDEGMQQVSEGDGVRGMNTMSPGYLDVITFADETKYDEWFEKLETTSASGKDVGATVAGIHQSNVQYKALILQIVEQYKGRNLTPGAKKEAIKETLRLVSEKFSFENAKDLADIKPFKEAGAEQILEGINIIMNDGDPIPVANLTWEDIYNWMTDEFSDGPSLEETLEQKLDDILEEDSHRLDPSGDETFEEFEGHLEEIDEGERAAYWVEYHKAKIRKYLMEGAPQAAERDISGPSESLAGTATQGLDEKTRELLKEGVIADEDEVTIPAAGKYHSWEPEYNQRGTGGVLLVDVLKSISENGSVLGRQVAALLARAPFIAKARIGLLRQEGFDPSKDRNRAAYVYWDDEVGGLYVREGVAESEYAILHETVHAITSQRIHKAAAADAPISKAKDKNIRDLFNQWEQAVDIHNERVRNDDESFRGIPSSEMAELGYQSLSGSLSGFKEFVADLFLSPALHEFLGSIKVEGNKTLLTRIIETIAKLIGIDAKGATLLEQSLSSLTKMVEDGAPVVGRPESGVTFALGLQLEQSFKRAGLNKTHKADILEWLEGYLKDYGGVDPIDLSYDSIEQLMTQAQTRISFRLEDGGTVESDTIDPQVREDYFRVVSALQHSGVDIKVFRQQMESTFGFLRHQGGSYNNNTKVVSLVLENILNPNSSGFLSVAHEAAHFLLGDMPMAEKQKLLEAIRKARVEFADKHLAERMERLKQMRSESPELASKIDEQMGSPEEILVEAVARKLKESDSSLNIGVVRKLLLKVKEVYYRILTAINSATNILPSGVAADIAASYLETRMRQWIGAGEASSDYLTHLKGANTSVGQRIGIYKEIHSSDPYVIEDQLNPFTGKIDRQEAAPGSPGAIDANGIHAFNQPIQRFTMDVPAGTNNSLWEGLSLPPEGGSVSELSAALGLDSLQEEVKNGEQVMGLPEVRVIPLSNAQMKESYPNKVAVYHQGAIFIAKDFARVGRKPANETETAILQEAQRLALAELIGHEYTHHVTDSVFAEHHMLKATGRTSKFARAAKQTVEDWGALLKAVRRAVNKTSDAWQYGLTSVEEFVSEARNNKEFQELLKGIALPEDLVKKFKVKGQMWDAFSLSIGRLSTPKANAAIAASNLFSRLMQTGADIQNHRKYTSFADKLRTWTNDMSATERLLFTTALSGLQGRLEGIPTAKTGQVMLEMRKISITPNDFVEVTEETEYDGVPLQPNVRYLLSYPKSEKNKTPPLSRAWSPNQHLSAAGVNYSMEGIPADQDMWRLLRTPSFKRYFGDWQQGYRGETGEQEADGVMWPRQDKTNEPTFVWHASPGPMGDMRVINTPTDPEGRLAEGYENAGDYETPISAHNVGREYHGRGSPHGAGGGADTKHGVMYATSSTSTIAHLSWRNRLWGQKNQMPMLANRMFAEYLELIASSVSGKIPHLKLGPDYATYKGEGFDPTPLHMTAFLKMDEALAHPYPISTLAFSTNPNDTAVQQLSEKDTFGGRLFYIPGDFAYHLDGETSTTKAEGNFGYALVHTSEGKLVPYKLTGKIPTQSAEGNFFIDPDTLERTQVQAVIRANDIEDILKPVSHAELANAARKLKGEYEVQHREALEEAEEFVLPSYFLTDYAPNQTWKDLAERYRVQVDALISANIHNFNTEKAQPDIPVLDSNKGSKRHRIRIPINESSRYVEGPAIAIFPGIRNPLIVNEDSEVGLSYSQGLFGNAALQAQHAYLPRVTPHTAAGGYDLVDDISALWSIGGGVDEAQQGGLSPLHGRDRHLDMRVPTKGISTVITEMEDEADAHTREVSHPFSRAFGQDGEETGVIEVDADALNEYLITPESELGYSEESQLLLLQTADLLEPLPRGSAQDLRTRTAADIESSLGGLEVPQLPSGAEALPLLMHLASVQAAAHGKEGKPDYSRKAAAIPELARRGTPLADIRVAMAINSIELADPSKIWGVKVLQDWANSKAGTPGVEVIIDSKPTQPQVETVQRMTLQRAGDLAGMSIRDVYRLAEAMNLISFKIMQAEAESGLRPSFKVSVTEEAAKEMEGSVEVAGLRLPSSYLSLAGKLSEGRPVHSHGSKDALHRNVIYLGRNAFEIDIMSLAAARAKVFGSKLLNMAGIFNPPANLLRIKGKGERWAVVRPIGVAASPGAPAGNTRAWDSAAKWVGVNITPESITNFPVYFPNTQSSLKLGMFMGDTSVGIDGGLFGQMERTDDMRSKEKALLHNIPAAWVKHAYRNSGYDVSQVTDKTITSIGFLSKEQKNMSLLEAMVGTEDTPPISPRFGGVSIDADIRHNDGTREQKLRELEDLARLIWGGVVDATTIDAKEFPSHMVGGRRVEKFIPGLRVKYVPDFYSEQAALEGADMMAKLEAQTADHAVENEQGSPISQLLMLAQTHHRIRGMTSQRQADMKQGPGWNINEEVSALLVSQHIANGEERAIIMITPTSPAYGNGIVSPFVDVPAAQVLTTSRTTTDLETFLPEIGATKITSGEISDQPKSQYNSFRRVKGLRGANKPAIVENILTGEHIVEKSYKDGTLDASTKVKSEILGSSIASYITAGLVPAAYEHTSSKKKVAQEHIEDAYDFSDTALGDSQNYWGTWPSMNNGGTPRSPRWMKAEQPHEAVLVLELISHMMADYVINNRDAHAGNFMYKNLPGETGETGPNVEIVGVDKGQAFKFSDTFLKHHKQTRGDEALADELNKHVLRSSNPEQVVNDGDIPNWVRRYYETHDNPASVYAQFLQEIQHGSLRPAFTGKYSKVWQDWRAKLATRLINIEQYFTGPEALVPLEGIDKEFSDKGNFKADLAKEISTRAREAVGWLESSLNQGEASLTEYQQGLPVFAPTSRKLNLPEEGELLAALLTKKGELSEAESAQQQRDLDPLKVLANEGSTEYSKHLVDLFTKSARSDIEAQEYDGIVMQRTSDGNKPLEDQVIILHPGNTKNEGGVASVQNQGEFDMHSNYLHYRLEDDAHRDELNEDAPEGDSASFTEYDGQQASANALLLETYREAFVAATSKGYKKSFIEFVKKYLPHNPEENLQGIAEYNPGSAGARISDYDGNQAMTDRILRFASELHSQSYFKAIKGKAKLADKIEVVEEEIEDMSETLASMVNRYKDADLQESIAQKEIRKIIKQYTRSLDGKRDLTEARSQLLSAIQEVDKQVKGDALTKAYRQAFEKLYDGEVSVYHYIQDMAKLGLDYNTVDEVDIITAVTTSKLPNMVRLGNNKPLLSVLVTFAKDNALQMSLLEARVAKSVEEAQSIEDELRRVESLSRDNLSKLIKSIKAGRKQTRKLFKVRDAYATLKMKLYRKSRRVGELRKDEAHYGTVIKTLKPRHEELTSRLGVGWEFQAVPGQEFIMMQLLADGTWIQSRAVYSNAATDSNRLLLNKAKHWNKGFLKEMADKGKADLPFVRMIQAQHNELSKSIVHREYQVIHANIIDRHLGTLEQRARALGQSGVAIARMVAEWRRVTMTNSDLVQKLAGEWEESYSNAISAAGMSKEVFNDLIYDTGIYWIENMPALANDQTALYRAVYNKVKNSLSPAVTDKFGKDLERYLQDLWVKTEAISKLEDDIANTEGVLVEDPSIQLANPLTGKKQNLIRRRIKYGRITIPRRMKGAMLSMLTKIMVSSGWRDNSIFSDIKGYTENPNLSPDEAFAKIMQAVTFPNASGKALLSENISEDSVVQNFLAPILEKPGDPIFTAPKEATGPAKKPIPQELVSLVWRNSESFEQFVLNLFLEYNANLADLPIFAQHVINKLRSIYVMAHRVADKVDTDPLSESTGFGPHHMMDARTNTAFPREWLEYSTFTKVEAGIHLSKLASVGAFGRDNSYLRAMLNKAQEEQRDKELPLAELKLHPDFDKLTTAKQRLKYIRKKLGRHVADQAVQADKGIEQVKRLAEDMVKLFSAPGAGFKDIKASEELITTAAALQLNTVKSGLWNIMSGTDWTTRLGYGSMSGKSTAKFFYHSIKQGFHSLFEGVGLGIVRASAVEETLNYVRSHPGQHDLTYKALTSNKGVHGNPLSAGVVKYTRGLREIMNRSLKGLLPFREKDSGKSGRVPFNALTAPFNWISNVVGMGISLTMVDNYRHMVVKALKYLQRDPDAINDPGFRFTLRNLKIGSGFFGGNQRALEYMEDAWAEHKGESFVDLVRRAGQRINEGAEIFSNEDYHTMHQIAMDDISLEGGLGSHPVSMRTSLILRTGSPLLKWATSKMNAVHKGLQTQEGRYTTQSVLKGLAGIAAWTMPIGVAASLLMDEYDEEILGKKSNLRPIKPTTLIPGYGLYNILSDYRGEGLAVMERLARSGNTYGLGGEAIYGMSAWTDPTQGQRSLGANRILIYSQISSARDSLLNIIHGEYANYEDLKGFRDIVLGQYPTAFMQTVNNLVGPTFEKERRRTKRIDAHAYMRGAARATGIALRKGGFRTSPTPLTARIRAMQLAAYGDDPVKFNEILQDAIRVSIEAGQDDPMGRIISSWKARSPLNMFAHKISDEELNNIFAVLNPRGRQNVSDLIGLHKKYLDFLEPDDLSFAFTDPSTGLLEGGRRALKPLPSMEQLRKRRLTALGL